MEPSGLFVTFEGIDGAGKSTHIAAVVQAFQAQGREVVATREPGGTPLAEKIRHLVLGDAMDPLCEALLVFAARRDHLRQVIEPALARGAVVVSDRYTDATFAYQGGGRGFDVQVLKQLEAWVQTRPDGEGVRQPDLTFWFDVPPAVAAARLARAREADRFEAETETFFERVAAGYAERAKAHPQRFVRINANAAPDVVHQRVLAVLAEKGWA